MADEGFEEMAMDIHQIAYATGITAGLGIRRIVQISACNGGDGNTDSLYALCSDGTLWVYVNNWTEIDPIPLP